MFMWLVAATEKWPRLGQRRANRTIKPQMTLLPKIDQSKVIVQTKKIVQTKEIVQAKDGARHKEIGRRTRMAKPKTNCFYYVISRGKSSSLWPPLRICETAILGKRKSAKA